MSAPRDHILNRLYVVLVLLSALPVLVVVQIVRVQLGQGEALRTQGEQQASSFVEIPAIRGTIYDRAGRVLAVNTSRFEVALDPTVPGFQAQAEAFYARLGTLTGHGAAHYRRLVARRTSPKYVLLVQNLDEAKKERLDEWDVPGLILTPRFGRRYTYDRLGAHVLGNVDRDLAGAEGLELQYDAYLRGTPGRRAIKVDRLRHQKALVGGSVVEPQHGQSLVLTLDLVLQAIVQEELVRGVEEAGAQWGTAVALDPRSGAVLAMANAPDYDPNRPAAFPAAARRNHAVTDKIEPGSTFKLVTSVAALEEGVIAPDDTLDTGPGWAVFGGRTLKDSHAYGRMSFADAVAKSSNVAFAQVAERIPPGDFYRHARAMGFGQPTWVDLPGEVTGVLKRPEQWSRTSRSRMAIGYEVEATPLQLAAAYAAMANGGLLVQPHVVAERRDVAGRTVWRAPQDSVRRAFRPATADTLLRLFEAVTREGGTATRASVDGLRIAGKTGTAQVAENGRYVPGAYRATFVGVFPADRPQVVLVVVMDRPRNGYYGGTVSGPVVGRIAERWKETFPVLAAAPAEPLPELAEVEVPAVTGLPGAIAAARLRAVGLDADPDGEARWQPVAAQRPAAGTALRAYRDVALEAERGVSRTMPDVRGLPTRQATAWLATLGVRARISGVGVVARQAPEPGASLVEEAVLTASAGEDV